jgi:hypothetical protein
MGRLGSRRGVARSPNGFLGTAALALLAWAAIAVDVGAQQQRAAVDLSRTVTYFIADGERGSGFRKEDRALAEWAVEAWGRQVDPAAKLVPGPEATATIRIYWVGANEGMFGEMRGRVRDGRFAADVYVHPNTDDLGADIARAARTDGLFRDAIVYLTCVHELGHAFGLQHTSAFADIMYSFQYGGDFVEYFMRFRRKLDERGDIRTASPFSAADVSRLRSLQER